MRMLNFPSRYRSGESPYDIHKNRMSAIFSIVGGIKNIILGKYTKGLLNTVIGQLGNKISSGQSTEAINLLNAEPTDIYPDDDKLNMIAGKFVDYANLASKEKRMGMPVGEMGQITKGELGLPATTPSTSEITLPQGDKMQFFNAFQEMGGTDFAPVLKYIEEHRPFFMGSFSPEEQWVMNQALGQPSQRDKLMKDMQAAEAVHKFFEEPTEKEPMKYVSTPYGILDKTTGELKEVEKPEEEKMKYTSTPYGILDKITGEIMKVEKIEEDKPNYQIKSVTDKGGNTYSFYINKDDPSASAIPVKGLPVGKGTTEEKPPTFYVAEKIEEGFMEKVENVQDFGKELQRLQGLGIDTKTFETTEYFAGLMEKKHKEMIGYVKYALDKIKNWDSMSEKEQAGEEYTYEQYRELYKEYWERANNYDQQYFNITGQHLLSENK